MRQPFFGDIVDVGLWGALELVEDGGLSVEPTCGVGAVVGVVRLNQLVASGSGGGGTVLLLAV